MLLCDFITGANIDIAIDLGKRKSYVVMEDNDRLVKEIHRNYKRRVLYFLRKGGKSEDYSGGQLFPHVTENFAVQHEAKFLADSAYDAATIRQRVHDAGMRDVIAVNGRGHYCSETPKDDDYGSRWLVEQTNSVLEMSYNLTSHRMRGILRITVHAFAGLIANFIEHFMD